MSLFIGPTLPTIWAPELVSGISKRVYSFAWSCSPYKAGSPKSPQHQVGEAKTSLASSRHMMQTYQPSLPLAIHLTRGTNLLSIVLLSVLLHARLNPRTALSSMLLHFGLVLQ